MNWIITSVVGVALIALAAILAISEHFWLRRSQIADGTVIELVRSRSHKGGRGYAPRVRFRAADGSDHEFTRSYSSSPAGFSTGEHVIVSYDPRTYRARILTFGQRFGFPAVIAFIGIALTCLAGFFIVGRMWVPRIYQQQGMTTHHSYYRSA